jgi:hypothetical protein
MRPIRSGRCGGRDDARPGSAARQPTATAGSAAHASGSTDLTCFGCDAAARCGAPIVKAASHQPASQRIWFRLGFFSLLGLQTWPFHTHEIRPGLTLEASPFARTQGNGVFFFHRRNGGQKGRRPKRAPVFRGWSLQRHGAERREGESARRGEAAKVALRMHRHDSAHHHHYPTTRQIFFSFLKTTRQIQIPRLHDPAAEPRAFRRARSREAVHARGVTVRVESFWVFTPVTTYEALPLHRRPCMVSKKNSTQRLHLLNIHRRRSRALAKSFAGEVR